MWKIHDGNMKKMLNSSSVIRQKDESKNGGYKKTNSPQIFRKTNVSYPMKDARVRRREQKALVFRKI